MAHLRSNTIEDISKIIINFKKNIFDRIEIAYLLIKLRPLLFGVSRDVSNLIVHEEKREKESYDLAKRLLNSIKDFMYSKDPSKGVVLKGIPQLITQQDLCRSINNALISINTTFDISKYEYQLMNSIIENIAGVELLLNKEDSEYIKGFNISEVEKKESGISNIYIEVVPYPSNPKKNPSPQVSIGENLKIRSVFMQALPNNTSASHEFILQVN
jgi:hypothetical protein